MEYHSDYDLTEEQEQHLERLEFRAEVLEEQLEETMREISAVLDGHYG